MTVERGDVTIRHSGPGSREHEQHEQHHGVDADRFVPELGTDGTLTEEPHPLDSSLRPTDRAKHVAEVVGLYAFCVAIALGLSALLVEVTGGSSSDGTVEVLSGLTGGEIVGISG